MEIWELKDMFDIWICFCMYIYMVLQLDMGHEN